ncbi:MAG: hypothetical protein RI897_3256 [Verrucomicrobiota bacterium]
MICVSGWLRFLRRTFDWCLAGGTQELVAGSLGGGHCGREGDGISVIGYGVGADFRLSGIVSVNFLFFPRFRPGGGLGRGP